MSIFKKKTPPAPVLSFPPEEFEPVIRSSICTGEKTACMRNRETGKMHELMLIRDREDLDRFGRLYGVDVDSVKTVY